MMDEIKRFLNGEEVDMTDELASYICSDEFNLNGSVYSYYRYTCGHTEFIRAWYISELDHYDEDAIVYHSYAKIDHESVYAYVLVTSPCPKCEEEQLQRTLEEEEKMIVKPYSYKPSEWIVTNPSRTERLFGVELECEFGSFDDAGGAAVELHDNYKRVLLKKDGSLKGAPGFESITHPADYRSAVELLSGVCKWLNFFDGDASYECGMHVHVSRKAFNSLAVSNLIVLVDNIWNDLYRFSRREEYELRWCSNRLEHTAGASKVTKKQEADQAAMEDDHRDRYHAINVTNKNTVEFRIFKGTVDIKQVVANLQLVDILVDLANSYDGFETSWSDVVNHAAMCGYEEFLEKEFEINETEEDEGYILDDNPDVFDDDIPW